MNLNQLLKLYCSVDRTDEELESLFFKVMNALNGGMHIGKAIEESLRMAHKTEKVLVDEKAYRDGNVVVLLIKRHRGMLLDLRMKGYGYGKIANILAKRKIYNKQTNKAYSRYTIRNALEVLRMEKEKNTDS